MIRIETVHPALLELIWDQCVPHINRVVAKSHGELTLDGVKQKVVTGNCVLFTIIKDDKVIAINTAEVRVMDSGLRALFIPITGGDNLDEWMPDFLILAKRLAKVQNCTELRGLAVRAGWMKKLEPYGWENVHMVIKCDIGD